MKSIPILLLSLFLGAAAPAQTLTVAVDSSHILIGEPFHLQVVGSFPQGQQRWITIDSLAHFEVLERGEIDTSQAAGSIRLSQVFTLTSWDSGKWQIPPIVLGSLRSQPLQMEVAFSPHPFDTTQPYHDMRDIMEVKKPVSSKWYWYLIFAGVLLILFLLFFPKEKRKKGAFVPQEGAYRKALRRLEALEKESPADAKAYYTELVHIFREYLHHRWNVHSFSKTTDDLALQMERLELPRANYTELVQTLRLSDGVKFARFQPSAAESTESLEVIRENITLLERLPHAV